MTPPDHRDGAPWRCLVGDPEVGLGKISGDIHGLRMAHGTPDLAESRNALILPEVYLPTRRADECGVGDRERWIAARNKTRK
jgi:hypothetical protein